MKTFFQKESESRNFRDYRKCWNEEIRQQVLNNISKTLGNNKLLMNVFLEPHFSYSILLWISRSRKLTNKINRLHERCLR